MGDGMVRAGDVLLEALVAEHPERIGQLLDLVGAADIADRLGVAAETLKRYRDQDGFPCPVREHGQWPLWSWYQIEEWLRSEPWGRASSLSDYHDRFLAGDEVPSWQSVA